MATIPKPTLAAIRELGQALVTSNAQTRQDIQHMLSNVVFQFQPGERNRALYEQDFYAWTQTTAERIRAGQWYDLDREALAEEVESLGRSERNALESRLERL